MLAKPLDPVQLYVAPNMVVAVKFRAPPAQTGLLLPAVIDEGQPLLTVRATRFEVTDPHVPVTTQSKPLAAATVSAICAFWTSSELVRQPA